ncbi:DsbE family thiol:disulfide interchange protein [Falsihalocynthiibacter arcticus]|uniref:Thiol:disulfide interchange protein n=1 Tax=Falsihalocynthiibacter arcticus TaxID=1579316 RepID=A0A126V3R7_9RHOB|nr:DsbE family thiol:disulfide interchange protein [Falsihalocynthiibacter arcticus]AML52329.1 thiol:disulfide interchange protein [Falsihalocynthiibacter arcticus]
MARISPWAVVPPLLFAGLAAVFYVGMYREDPSALPSVLIGKEVPVLTLSSFEGSDVLSAETLALPGVKLVNFWASWCVPCRAEHPQLEEMAQTGVTIHGLNYKDKPEAAAKFLAELGDPFATISADDTGRTGRDWGVYGVPETFVIDGDGKVILRFAGPITQRVMKETILPAIEEATP